MIIWTISRSDISSNCEPAVQLCLLLKREKAMPLTIPRFASNAQLQAASANKPPLQQGARGEGVAILQQALIDLGFDMPNSTQQRTCLPDGIFGSETARTIKAFQRLAGLHVDGIVGRRTLDALQRLIVAAADVEERRFAFEFVQTGLVS
jgi:peptidoglycan hydrolase-like protein with peptidoglycan-binding domain